MAVWKGQQQAGKGNHDSCVRNLLGVLMSMGRDERCKNSSQSVRCSCLEAGSFTEACLQEC